MNCDWSGMADTFDRCSTCAVEMCIEVLSQKNHDAHGRGQEGAQYTGNKFDAAPADDQPECSVLDEKDTVTFNLKARNPCGLP